MKAFNHRGSWGGAAGLAVVVGLAVGGAVGGARAQSTAFTLSRPVWESATSGAALVATFSESLWPVNAVLSGEWTLNGVTYSGHAGTPGPNIYVINPSPLTGPALTANGDEDIDLVMSTPRTAIGIDISVNPFGPVTVSVFGENGAQLGAVDVAPNTQGFIGCVSGTPIRRLNFRSVRGAQINSLLDNVRLANSTCVGAALTAAPASTQACPSDTALFSMDASGTGPIAYEWQVESPAGSGQYVTLSGDTFSEAGSGLQFNLSGVNGSQLGVSQVRLGNHPNVVQFRGRASNLCGSVTSGGATLTICACLDCPADFNQDGGVDGTDVSAFFDRWEIGQCDADVNADGGVDGTDVSVFFAAWEAGGC